jgi:flavin-dependent dehydrogenase
VEVRERFTVDEIVFDDGVVTGIRGCGADGTTVVERARVVIGADGRYSRVPRAVQPEQYHEKPTATARRWTRSQVSSRGPCRRSHSSIPITSVNILSADTPVTA